MPRIISKGQKNMYYAITTQEPKVIILILDRLDFRANIITRIRRKLHHKKGSFQQEDIILSKCV